VNGADYIAKVRLSTRADETLALPGERCDRVPAQSLPWLAEQGLIELAPATNVCSEVEE
jgi:hypothetical protein